jgi:hypothetical protein
MHDAWVGFVCVKCHRQNHRRIGQTLLEPVAACEDQAWECAHCGQMHSRTTDLPFDKWPREFRRHGSLRVARFWQGFFRIATEDPQAYWKQCNACGRILPRAAFSGHTGWGPLERQMECRACKGAINAELNRKRTPQQMHESSARRRVAELLLKGQNQPIDIGALFARFEGKCFKTGVVLNKSERKTWAIDHILPSKYLYPLRVENAALMSIEANNKKRAAWPKDYYDGQELVRLAEITGADLNLLSSPVPVVNPEIDVDACVGRVLKVRTRTNLAKKLPELRKLIRDYGLAGKLSAQHRRMIGLDKPVSRAPGTGAR